MPRKTNIIIRNGTTTPSGSDFNVGEPAWDKTAKKLYIKAGDNTMAEIGRITIDPVIAGMIF